MMNKMKKILKNQKGFTLIELITVIVILGIILGIGIPRYLHIQFKQEWNSDAVTLRSVLKSAELYYVQNPTDDSVSFGDLISQGYIDDVVLKRKIGSGGDSERNVGSGALKLSDHDRPQTEIKINSITGKIDWGAMSYGSEQDWIEAIIGKEPGK
ncbi:MAG TPA: prepilin-type N-terminal cleavage/methylation domain-containing protein [Peptococcaceae bacterium]|jgi:type IV pilus assembly protein PilA|nr:prepilin-type N-terminal cleavage/methylation domain-containing protein [Peptococcaceae bacterium]HPZ70990.1 prepilin-type N-terminal cleavage/methylation domain-containing protein [Peptococcaceae bacterium]HQD53291.1 prepilin-type N-terminal cleavage/methylation domain-containing protein [Peptococcaceae bacterium]